MATFPYISCCCSNGIGSSMIVSMNVKTVLKQLGVANIPVRHIPLSEAGACWNDLFVVGLDISPQMRSFRHVIVLNDLISRREIEAKLKEALERGSEPFWIE